MLYSLGIKINLIVSANDSVFIQRYWFSERFIPAIVPIEITRNAAIYSSSI